MENYVLKPNSIAGEYYCGDLPGRIQYKKDAGALKGMDLSGLAPAAADAQWKHEACTAENLHRLLPHTQSPADWTLRMVMKRINEDDSVWLKGALVNNETGEIALLTAASSSEAITSRENRAIKANADGWFVGHYRMGAPLIFWRTLQNVLGKRRRLSDENDA